MQVHSFDIISSGRVHLERALQFAQDDMPEPGGVSYKATHWSIQHGALWLHWSNASSVSGVVALPVALCGTALVEFVLAWLGAAKYPDEPDTDGSTEKGFRCTNEEMSGWAYTFAVIEPAWIVYGK